MTGTDDCSIVLKQPYFVMITLHAAQQIRKLPLPREIAVLHPLQLFLFAFFLLELLVPHNQAARRR